MHKSPTISRHSQTLAAQLSLYGAVWLCGPAAGQGSFPPPGPDIPQTSTRTMIDAEFNLDKRLFTWVDTVSGDIWVASYDFETGQFVPEHGRGVLIEAAVSTGGDYPGLGFTVNGPEWALGNNIDAIVYTRNNAPGDPKRGNALIGVASLGADGTWTRQTLPTPRRNGPYGSLNRNDEAMASY